MIEELRSYAPFSVRPDKIKDVQKTFFFSNFLSQCECNLSASCIFPPTLRPSTPRRTRRLLSQRRRPPGPDVLLSHRGIGRGCEPLAHRHPARRRETHSPPYRQ